MHKKLYEIKNPRDLVKDFGEDQKAKILSASAKNLIRRLAD
jgi:hypothetical protein